MLCDADSLIDEYNRNRNAGSSLAGDSWFDAAGRVIKQIPLADSGDILRRFRADWARATHMNNSREPMAKVVFLDRDGTINVDQGFVHRSQPLDAIRSFSAGNMLDLFRARLTPRRRQCCLLAWKALTAVIKLAH